MKIKFVGKKSGRAPLKSITDGNDLIVLPENQSRAFSHPQAKAILQHAPDLYRKVIEKGRSRNVHRSAASGRFVSKTFADANPETTVREAVN